LHDGRLLLIILGVSKPYDGKRCYHSSSFKTSICKQSCDIKKDEQPGDYASPEIKMTASHINSYGACNEENLYGATKQK
jgi:hypothetical protein